jgi:hypothetical protein
MFHTRQSLLRALTLLGIGLAVAHGSASAEYISVMEQLTPTTLSVEGSGSLNTSGMTEPNHGLGQALGTYILPLRPLVGVGIVSSSHNDQLRPSQANRRVVELDEEPRPRPHCTLARHGLDKPL